MEDGQNSRIEALETRLQTLETEITTLKTDKDGVGDVSSQIDKDKTSQNIYKQLNDFFFDEISFLSYPNVATQDTNVTSTTTYDADISFFDTSQGEYLRINNPSRMRCLFYLSPAANPANVDTYILSPAVIKLPATGSAGFWTANGAYAGVKLYAGRMSLVSKSARGVEKVRPTNIVVTGDETYVIDIEYTVEEINVTINNEYVGSMPCDFRDFVYDQNVFYSLTCPIRSINGNAVKSNVEGYQFLQRR